MVHFTISQIQSVCVPSHVKEEIHEPPELAL